MKQKAVFITRSTNFECVRVWDAEVGIIKTKGCVFYQNSKGDVRFSVWTKPAECREKYLDYPEEGTAYFVEPKPYGWLWTRIDHKMQLLTGGDTTSWNKSILWL